MCTTTYLSQHDLAVLTRFVRARSADPCRVEAAVRRLAHLTAVSRTLPSGDSDDGARRVSLGASVRYRVAACGTAIHQRTRGGADLDTVVIACPQDAQAMTPRVSVLAPLALGLLGHAEGCTVDVDLALGRTLRLEIVEVQPPAALPV
ncbi:GreA/GreB family elongation factor [Massilia alkalitolerans]|jgi:transcription elongation GreA/GreB family factor|uniref:GreA/GreB family elongation factor n=1 Tax=Massilia alkalitolerans TaxID=286638 RepID=UPI000418708C|nr:GreA/GreB family elongation factor [Massilia alkalitolerans]